MGVRIGERSHEALIVRNEIKAVTGPEEYAELVEGTENCDFPTAARK